MASSRRSDRQIDPAAAGISPGCLFAVISTFVTCFLLFINGGLVSALCNAASESWPQYLGNPELRQFILFVGPVVLVVIQWMMIDYVTSRLRRWP